MYWADELARRLPPEEPQVVNDSKTPSGVIPISALRGPVIHDAIYRALHDAGLRARFTFGIDDMDPMDSQSMRTDEAMAAYMGRPLWSVPSPDGGAPDFATFHADRFLATFADLGIQADVYRVRDLYREGKFDRSIDLVLRQADVAREVLRRFKVRWGSEPSYHPLFVICENCGRIGTTYATSYDGAEVTYECRADLVSWAEGCGHKGSVSPFGGRAKLPFNFEWCAKWDALGVTVETAGKDISTAGGSRERSEALYRAIWKREPPLNHPYEFVTVGGKKMSTSHAALWKELGAAAHEVVELLTGEIVRFFMLRTRPSAHIEFDPSGDRVPKAFDDYDRAAEAFATEPQSDLGRAYALSQLDHAHLRTGFRVRFGILANWLQIPSIDPASAAAELVGRSLTEWERAELARRARVARNWLERWAPEEARFTVTPQLPAAARELTQQQRELLRRVRAALDGLDGEQLQEKIYEIRAELGLASKDAFAAVYLAFIGKPHGPRAGWLLTSLEREFARRRLEEAASS